MFKPAMEKQRATILCHAGPGSGSDTLKMCVCVADRAGEPAGSAGPSSVGVPQPRC